MEHWKPIPRYVGWYEVSNAGRVRSVDRWINFSDGRRRFYRGQLRALYEDWFGYKKVTLQKNGNNKRAHVHHLVALAFIGPRPRGADICHSDGDHLNNVPSNLRYDTRKANHGDTIKHGRQPRGESSYAAKLTNRKVLAIRRLRGKVTGRELALRFGTSPVNICNIQKRRRWTHI